MGGGRSLCWGKERMGGGGWGGRGGRGIWVVNVGGWLDEADREV